MPRLRRVRLFPLALAVATGVGRAAAEWQDLAFSNCGSDAATFVPSAVLAAFADGLLRLQVFGTQSESLPAVDAATNTASTLFAHTSTLSYTVDSSVSPFCPNVTSYEPGFPGTCPWGPGMVAFQAAMHVKHSYPLTTLTTRLRVLEPSHKAREVVCVEIYATPVIDPFYRKLLMLLPLVPILFLGLMNVLVAIFNPWTGTWDIFRATSNFGFHLDALRLVTPGLIDAWQYAQFIVMTASLDLKYPGFFQPIVSHFGWANLLINSTFADSHPMPWTNSTIDFGGAIDWSQPELINSHVNTPNGLGRLINLVGIPVIRAWPTVLSWFFILLVAAGTLVGIVLSISWIKRIVCRDDIISLKRFALPFLCGTLVRMYLLFQFPVVTITIYNLTLAGTTTWGLLTVSAIVFAIGAVLFTAGLSYRVLTIRPRQTLYDDLSVLLKYGPLYNTLRESHTIFSALFLSAIFLKAVVVGGIQTSSVAQIVLLSLIELALLLSICLFQPYYPRSLLNVFFGILAFIRLLITVFLIAFIPKLNISAANRGWIGYIILVLHALVFLFGFLGNALTKMLELIVRLSLAASGISNDSDRGFGLRNAFGIQQLRRRRKRPSASNEERYSPEMTETNNCDIHDYNISLPTDPKHCSHYDLLTHQCDQIVYNAAGESTYHYPNICPAPSSDYNIPSSALYYRQPKLRKVGSQTISPVEKIYRQQPIPSPLRTSFPTDSNLPSSQTHFSIDDDQRPQSRGSQYLRPDVDYAVREADAFYYRHPDTSQPLSDTTPARPLGTGPIDPTGPLAQAKGFWRKMMGKKVERGTFEVVRPPGWGNAPPSVNSSDPSSGQNATKNDNFGAALSAFREGPPRVSGPGQQQQKMIQGKIRSFERDNDNLKSTYSSVEGAPSLGPLDLGRSSEEMFESPDELFESTLQLVQQSDNIISHSDSPGQDLKRRDWSSANSQMQARTSSSSTARKKDSNRVRMQEVRRSVIRDSIRLSSPPEMENTAQVFKL